MNNNFKEICWWSTPKETLLELLHVSQEKGLSDQQVIEHRKTFGANTLETIRPKSLQILILEGIREPMMLLLLTVAILSLIFGKITEALAMVLVIAAYVSVELINKFRTDRTMIKLKKLVSKTTNVMRNGKISSIKINDVVIGDILILSEGVRVSADARLLSSYSLIVDEATLTGESLSITKNANTLVDKNSPLPERINSIYSQTTVLSGEGTALVIAIGEKSEFGKIAQQVQQTQKEKTILQESMTKLAKILAIFALGTSVLIPAIGYLQGLSLQEMILTWLSLTFLMIPGQPPIIITMALALTAFRLAKKQVIVKRLHGVEIIGQVTSVISDKTGTMTESTMTLETYFIDAEKTKILPKDIQEKILLALPDYHSNPTDKAVFDALKYKKKIFNQIGFSGFSDNKPWRDMIYTKNKSILHVISGSPEIVIAQSTLSTNKKKIYSAVTEQQANQGKRVVAYGFIENNSPQLENLQNITFIALAVISDPVRHGIKEAIATLEKAGVTTFIVTGDHKVTAQAIASEIGFSGEVITGNEIDHMDDQKLIAKLKQSHIFARTDPLQKLRLVKLLQQEGEVVAVIGDGVNDAPALKAAQDGFSFFNNFCNRSCRAGHNGKTHTKNECFPWKNPNN